MNTDLILGNLLNAPMLFFASDASAYVTGAHVTVDDGQSL